MKIHEFSKSAPLGKVSALAAHPNLWQCARAFWTQFVRARKRHPRRLPLCESLSLGDHRFVAVISYEQSRFLLGATSGSLVLLTRLGKDPENETAPESDLRSDFFQEPLG